MSDCVPLPRWEMTGHQGKRKTERVYCQRPVQLRTSDNREFTAACTDVNLSGIGIDSEKVLSVGQRLELLLPEVEGAQKRVPMLVIYRMNNHYGLSALAAAENVVQLLPVQ